MRGRFSLARAWRTGKEKQTNNPEQDSEFATTHTHFSRVDEMMEEVVSQPDLASAIYIFGTGGTIAGKAESSSHAVYEPSQLGAGDVLASVPEIQKDFKEKMQVADVFHVNSEDMTGDHWLKLAKAVNECLARDDVKGLVITHGTDTLEETAYFLDLTVKSDKPVVVVGAMRAATSMSADGNMNLYNAIAVVHDEKSRGRGVMVVLNDTIHSARDVTKCNTTEVQTFQSPNSGPIGKVNYGKVRFDRKVERKHTTETPFDVSECSSLPDVKIIYEYAGSRDLLKAAIKLKPDGIVIAGTGDGNLSAPDRALLDYAVAGGIQIVRSSRTGSGTITEKNRDYPKNQNGTIAGDNLNPQKARILLMLSLSISRQSNEIRHNFQTY